VNLVYECQNISSLVQLSLLLLKFAEIFFECIKYFVNLITSHHCKKDLYCSTIQDEDIKYMILSSNCVIVRTMSKF